MVVARDETMTTKNGVLPYTIEVVADDATLTARAGLPLVMETMRAVGLSDALDRTLLIRRRNSGATDAQKVEALVHAVAKQTRVTRATLDHDATIQESHKGSPCHTTRVAAATSPR
jgi:hypothetical protein